MAETEFDAEALRLTLDHFGFPPDDEDAVRVARKSFFYAGTRLRLATDAFGATVRREVRRLLRLNQEARP